MKRVGFGLALARRWYSSAVPSYVEIATKQNLYIIDKTTPGSVFFTPHGTRIFDRLIEFMKLQQRAYGFEHVVTPIIYKNELWETSGHYEHYKDDMFTVSGGSEQDPLEFSLKPMNCPGHCVMFARHDHSFRELPIRYSDFSPLHRNEASGALTGLTRVRKFHQDDGHIFCQPSQVQQEIEYSLQLIQSTYQKFGFDDLKYVLSTRPEKFTGDVEVWNKAEEALTEALNKTSVEWSLNPEDGAFYGPKIDIQVTDKNGKRHQTATIQLDFQLPRRFELEYQGANGMETPVMIHRAVYGSLERFMALLIDHYEGKWPFWLNPRQAVVVPVAERHASHAETIQRILSGKTFNDDNKLGSRAFNVELSASDETVGARIRRANDLSTGYVLMIGDKEIDSGKIAVRARGSRATQLLSLEEVQELFAKLEEEYK